MVIVITAIMPSMLVIVPMVIAVIVALARRDHAARSQSHEAHYQAVPGD
jgi:hypothetical protein